MQDYTTESKKLNVVVRIICNMTTSNRTTISYSPFLFYGYQPSLSSKYTTPDELTNWMKKMKRRHQHQHPTLTPLLLLLSMIWWQFAEELEWPAILITPTLPSPWVFKHFLKSNFFKIGWLTSPSNVTCSGGVAGGRWIFWIFINGLVFIWGRLAGRCT